MVAVYIILGLALVIIIWNYLFSTKIKLQSINVFTGGLGSSKTFNAVKLALKLMWRSVRDYYLIGKHPVIFAISLFFIFLIGILQLPVNILSIALLIINFVILYCLISKREYLKKRFKIRKIYSNFPIIIKGNVALFEKYNERIRKLEELLFTERTCKPITFALKLSKKIEKLKATRDKKVKFSEPLTLEMLLGKVRIEEGAIIIIDEASLVFPAQTTRSNPEITWNFKLDRHFFDPTIILTTQSIGDLDVSLRRVINVVYNLSSFRKILFFFFKVDIDKINYMEDVVVNTNDIKEDNHMFNFGILGSRKYDSRYMRRYYHPEQDKLGYGFINPTLDPDNDMVNKYNEFILAFNSANNKNKPTEESVVLEATTYE